MSLSIKKVRQPLNAVLKEINDAEPGSITGDDILYGFDGNDSLSWEVQLTLL